MNVPRSSQAEQFILGLKAADAEARGHMRAIHEHVLSLLDDAEPDEDE